MCSTWTVCASAGYTLCSGRTSVHLCTASLQNLAVQQDILFLSRCSSGMILLTLYSMVWDWRVSRVGPMLLYWPKLLYPCYSLLYFSVSLLSVYRLVLWGWGLWTDRVYTTLSQPCTAWLFNNNNNYYCMLIYVYIFFLQISLPVLLLYTICNIPEFRGQRKTYALSVSNGIL